MLIIKCSDDGTLAASWTL